VVILIYFPEIMNNLLDKIRDHERNWFDTLVVWVIILSSVVIGFETDTELHTRYFSFFHFFELTVILFFSLEVIISIYAHSPKPFNYFKSGWNLFDFFIIVASIIPFVLQSNDNTANAVLILRIFRLARVFRIFTIFSRFPSLKVLVETLIDSLPSMAYVSILMLILFYVYGVVGVILFSSNDPIHFGNLQTSFLTLFQVVTGEDWPELLKIQMYGSDLFGYYNLPGIQRVSNPQPVIAVIYFVTFILVGAMVILNLFIGIIVNRMNIVAQNNQARQNKNSDQELFNSIEAKLSEVNILLDMLRNKESGKTD